MGAEVVKTAFSIHSVCSGQGSLKTCFSKNEVGSPSHTTDKKINYRGAALAEMADEVNVALAPSHDRIRVTAELQDYRH